MLENAITKSNSPYYICLFAKDVKGVNKKKLSRILIQINNYTYIDYFANNIKNGLNILLSTILEKTDANIFGKYINREGIEDNYIIINKFANEIMKNYIKNR